MQEWVGFRPAARGTRAASSSSRTTTCTLAERAGPGRRCLDQHAPAALGGCGTSGMKVLVNGGINFSELDGWWAEAYTPEVGWALGGDDGLGSGCDATRRRRALRVLEDRRHTGVLRSRRARAFRAAGSRSPRKPGQAHAALQQQPDAGEYVERYYLPAEAQLSARLADGARPARAIDAWTRRLTAGWGALRYGRLETKNTELGAEILIETFFGELTPDDVTVELYADGDVRIGMTNAGALPGTASGFQFRAALPAGRSPNDYTLRFVPASGRVAIPQELPLIAWHH